MCAVDVQMAANMVKNNQPRTTPLYTVLALEPPVETVVEVATDGFVVVDPALKVVIEPVEAASVRVVREGVVMPLMVVREPPEVIVEASNETTVLLPGTGETTVLLPGAEETTVEADSMTVGEVPVAGGAVGASEVAGTAGAAEHSAVTVTVE